MDIPTMVIEAIKDKKELRGIDNTVVLRVSDEYFSTHSKEKKALDKWNPKAAVSKKIIKEIRAMLREIYGVFQKTSLEQRQKLFDEFLLTKGKGAELQALNKLLLSHQSTQERVSHYKEIYHNIFTITGKPQKILDLGCGFNPLAYQWLGCNPKYDCCDISRQDMNLVQEFFNQTGINGRAFVADLITIPKLPVADVTFLFKLVDTLETQERNVTKKLLTSLITQWSVVSFPTVSIGGRGFREGGKENWFTRFLDEKGFAWSRFDVPGEEFYLIKH